CLGNQTKWTFAATRTPRLPGCRRTRTRRAGRARVRRGTSQPPSSRSHRAPSPRRALRKIVTKVNPILQPIRITAAGSSSEMPKGPSERSSCPRAWTWIGPRGRARPSPRSSSTDWRWSSSAASTWWAARGPSSPGSSTSLRPRQIVKKIMNDSNAGFKKNNKEKEEIPSKRVSRGHSWGRGWQPVQ
ncbi:ventral anterior homeobox 1 isoform b, partial [Daubentonia madagascariensis]